MKIEDLYSTSLNSSPIYDEKNTEWIKIDTELKRKEFYTFSFYRFNVYYVGLLLLNLFTTAWMINSHINHKHDMTSNHSHTHIQQPEEYKTPDLVTSTKEINSLKEVDTAQNIQTTVTPTSQQSSRKKTPIDLNIEDLEPSAIIIDTTQTKIDSSNISTPVIKKETPILEAIKDTVIIHKKDTIIQIDSIKVSNRKWKKINKK